MAITTRRAKIKAAYTTSDLEHVVSQLRIEDEREVEAVGFRRGDLMTMAMLSKETSFTAFFDGKPTFIFGIARTYPRHASLWGFGTDQTRRVIPEVTRFIRETWAEYIFGPLGITRLEVRVHGEHRQSLNWLTSLGMVQEATLVDYGVNGETFYQLVGTKDRFNYVYAFPWTTSLPFPSPGSPNYHFSADTSRRRESAR